MALILLREQFFARPVGGSAPFYKVSDFYDEGTRTPYSTQADAQTNTPRFELVKDAPISRYQVTPRKELVVYYDGQGSIYTRPDSVALLNNVEVKLGLLPIYVSSGGAADACVDITGINGLPPYRIELRGVSGAATGYLNTGSASPSELFPVRYYNLRAGDYSVVVRDALNRVAVSSFTTTANNGEAMTKELRADYNAVGGVTLRWSYNGQNILTYLRPPAAPRVDQLAYGLQVDGFFSQGTTNWRRVYSDGKGGVYLENFALLPASELTLHNIIEFHPDSAQEDNGGLVIELNYTHAPLEFVLTGTSTAGPVSVTNATGIFDGLGDVVGDVVVTDQLGQTLSIPVKLSYRYAKRWKLEYDDLYGTPLRMELWLKGYTGPVEDLIMTGTPVENSSDGLNSAIGGQGDIPPVIGSEVKLNFLVDTDLFEPIVTSSYTDRFCRADIYYKNQLEWRGFVRPDSYDAPMLSGPQEISISATDGLASLKDTYFTGHQGQRLIGHRPVLYTLLHCLSRCDVALPLRLLVNRRERSMGTTEAPELAITTNRTGYWDEEKNEPWNQRQVVDALAQLLGGTLVQRQGTWQIRSALEAAKPAAGRSYLPAGTPGPALLDKPPFAPVEPPQFKRLYWLNAGQHKNVRAGWKSLTGKTDTGYLENAYVAGKVFSDKYSWLGYGSGGLQPISGWTAVDNIPFPATLEQVGEKGRDYTTKWPRSSGYSFFATRPALQGPDLPLAAGLEAVPATLQFTGRFVPEEYYVDADGNTIVAPTNAANAVLTYELIVDGQGTGQRFVEFELGKKATDKDVVVSVPLAGLPSATMRAELRIYTWYAADTMLLNNTALLNPIGLYKAGDVVKLATGNAFQLFIARLDTGGFTLTLPNRGDYWAELTATNGGLGTFYLSEAGVQLTPQNATWEGEDNVRIDGPAGNIRPKEELEVTHADPPRRAGLFGGNLFAFAKAAGLADGTIPNSWARSVDLAPAPLFENNVLDGLALRANPSRLVIGDLRYENGAPVRLLDTLDTPYDGLLAGRRFLVVALSPWNMKAAEVSVSLVEIGAGQGAPNPLILLPVGLRVAHKVYQYLPGQYAPYARMVHGGGVRVVHI